MSLLTVDIAAYLQAQGHGTVGTDLFDMRRPDSPLVLTCLYPLPGAPPVRTGSRERPEMQIVTRAGTQVAALERTYEVYQLLHGMQNVKPNPSGSTDVLTCEAVMSPHPLEPEQAAGGRAFTASFRVLFDLRKPSS